MYQLLAKAKILLLTRLQPLMVEAEELLAITVSSIKTARTNKKNAE